MGNDLIHLSARNTRRIVHVDTNYTTFQSQILKGLIQIFHHDFNYKIIYLILEQSLGIKGAFGNFSIIFRLLHQ